MHSLINLPLGFLLETATGVLLLRLVDAVRGHPLAATVALHLLIARYHLDNLVHRVALGCL